MDTPMNNGTHDMAHDRPHYEQLYTQLRERLVKLQSAPVPDLKAIDETIEALDQTQLALKAIDGAPGNRPSIDDAPR